MERCISLKNATFPDLFDDVNVLYWGIKNQIFY
jgi:hypothetical protein